MAVFFDLTDVLCELPFSSFLFLPFSFLALSPSSSTFCSLHSFRHHKLDLLLTPGTALPAHTHQKFSDVTLGVIYLSLFNLLDWTAGTVPVTVVRKEEDGKYEGSVHQDKYDHKGKEQMTHATGLPMGVQISGPSGHEEIVLRAMKDLENVIQFRNKFEPKGLGKDLPSRM